MLLWISIGVAVAVAAGLFRVFFKDLPDFVECLRFYFQPNFISWLRGEWREDWWASWKLGVWMTLSLAMGGITMFAVPKVLPSLGSQRIFVRAHSSQSDLEDTPKPPLRVSVPTNTVSGTTSNASALPDYATHYGVKVGSNVEIVALNRTIALRRATITAMDQQQISVQSGNDAYSFKWEDINRLKPASGSLFGRK
jgi:hypothetical protein